ncbi:uncharacterized protein AB675_625 [Cyphellophora attinorum]|uniref:Uncharacterized protein n=1 Tax=Cyphellophora attinorum TaxID=1664694 RepID=A0A0N1HBA5_9EURO|nr:uncharacterized protein AB675_625 [Phialophora attinorum]KPI45784.1 hypothetical protein AB675_625 [Phialophora attinorum]
MPTIREIQDNIRATGWQPGQPAPPPPPPPPPPPRAPGQPLTVQERFRFLRNFGFPAPRFPAPQPPATNAAVATGATETATASSSSSSSTPQAAVTANTTLPEGSTSNAPQQAVDNLPAQNQPQTSPQPRPTSTFLQSVLFGSNEQAAAPTMSSSSSSSSQSFSQSDEEPPRPEIPIHDYVHGESSERYFQNQRDPFYASQRPQLPQPGHPIAFQDGLNQSRRQIERDIVNEMVLDEEVLNPLDLNTLPSLVEKMQAALRESQEAAQASEPGIPLAPFPPNLLQIPNPHLTTFRVPGFNIPVFLAQHSTIQDRQRALFLFYATPAGQRHFRNLISHNLVSIRSALHCVSHNLKALDAQANSVAGTWGLELLLDPEKGQEINAAHAAAAAAPRTSRRAQAPSPSPHNRIHRGIAVPRFETPDPNASRSSFGFNFPDPPPNTDPVVRAANKAFIHASFARMEQGMSDAFFWKGVLLLETRMSEAMLARLECAGECTGILAQVYSGQLSIEGGFDGIWGTGASNLGGSAASGSGSAAGLSEEAVAAKEKLVAAGKRWEMLGEVVRACWGAAAARLGGAFAAADVAARASVLAATDGSGDAVVKVEDESEEGQGHEEGEDEDGRVDEDAEGRDGDEVSAGVAGEEAATEGWRCLRARHAGELWDVVEDARELGMNMVEDAKWWDGE